MGTFSWLKADKLTDVANIAHGEKFKFLIPKEFGGGFILDTYQGYGRLGLIDDCEPKHDMYELLAFWNKMEGIKHDGDFPPMKEIDRHTDKNRTIGVNNGIYDKDVVKLKYPLKLVSPEFIGTYEDLLTCSFSDPDQGFFEKQRNDCSVYIVCISIDYCNARRVCEAIENSVFSSGDALKGFLQQKLEIDEDVESSGFMVFSLTDFMDASNDEVVDLNHYFISYIKISE